MSDFLRSTRLTRSRVLALIVVVSGCWAGAVAGAIYKWVDDQGKVHYSDKPPAQSDTQEMDVKSDPAAGTPGLNDDQRRQKQQRVLDAFAKERAEKEAERAKLAEEKKEQKEWCASARNELREIQEAGFLYDYDENGEKVIYSKEARAKATGDLEGRISKNCRNL